MYSLTLIGINFAIFSTIIWPSFSFLVNQENLGLSLGIVTCLINFGCMVMPVVVVSLKDTSNTKNLMNILIIMTIVAFILLINVIRNDRNKKGNSFKLK